MPDLIDDKDIEQIEAFFGLPNGFVSGLEKEDDWGFVIKTHALFEALFTQLLVEVLNQPALKQDLYRLPMNGKCSKISFLSSLDSFEPEHKKEIQKFVQGLSELRNKIVHHAENLSFSFSDYYESLKKKDKNTFKTTICYFSNTAIGFKNAQNEELFKGNIRGWVNLTVFVALQILSLYVQNAKLENEYIELRGKLNT